MRFVLIAVLLAWCVSIAPAQEEKPAESAAESAEKAAEAAEKADQEPPPPRRGGKILLPGGGAYGAEPSPSKPSPAASSPAAPIPPPSAESRSVQPEAPAQTTGDLFWNGRIYKNGRIRISIGNETTAGTVEGDALPGVAVVVDARSPIVEILEQPSARDSYKSFEFQVKKTNKKPVTLNFHWSVKP